jgi:hypothetical protein
MKHTEQDNVNNTLTLAEKIARYKGDADSERPSGTAEYFSQDRIQDGEGGTHP